MQPFLPLLLPLPLPLSVFQRLQNPTTLSALIGNTKEWLTSNHTDFHPYQHELNTINYTDRLLELREPQVCVCVWAYVRVCEMCPPPPRILGR